MSLEPTTEECCIEIVCSMSDKAVSTDDLQTYYPNTTEIEIENTTMNQRTTMSSVVANELLRLEAALNAVMKATSPTEDEIPVVSIRRPRSHSHHHCAFNSTGIHHSRRSRIRSASAVVLQQQHNSPYYCNHHYHCGGPSVSQQSTLSSYDDGCCGGGGGTNVGTTKTNDHLCLDVELQAKRKRKKKRKRKNSKSGTSTNININNNNNKKPKDDDELPKRARWTIVATACMLLFMCFLLVGITLRMAPIIDEMVRKENEQLMNSLNRAGVTDEITISMMTNLSSSTSMEEGVTNKAAADAVAAESIQNHTSSTIENPT